MKKTILLTLLFTGIFLYSVAQKSTFLRVYNIAGKKIAKGFFAGTTDSTILLAKDHAVAEIPVNKIGIIRTKRSPGHTVLITSLSFATLAAILGAIVSGSDNEFLQFDAGTSVAGGFIFGAAAGAAVGLITGGLKKGWVYHIDGQTAKWITLKPDIDKMTIYQYSPN